MGALHRKRFNNVEVKSVDANVWSWTVGGSVYRWCKLGHLEYVGSSGLSARIACFRDLGVAVGWTLGYHQSSADRRAVADRETK